MQTLELATSMLSLHISLPAFVISGIDERGVFLFDFEVFDFVLFAFILFEIELFEIELFEIELFEFEVFEFEQPSTTKNMIANINIDDIDFMVAL
jgi:hypothetical protein